jgi:hypothetical protein
MRTDGKERHHEGNQHHAGKGVIYCTEWEKKMIADLSAMRRRRFAEGEPMDCLGRPQSFSALGEATARIRRSVCDNLITLGSEIELLSELSLAVAVLRSGCRRVGVVLPRSKCGGGLDGRVGAVRFSEA